MNYNVLEMILIK